MLTSYIKKSHWLYVLIILFFSILGMKALFHPGLFTAHDIWHQVARIYHYQKAITDGEIPPYWINNMANGYGYPLFFFSYHMPWLISLPFLKLGIDIPTTLKILFFISFFTSGITMYFFVYTIFKNKLAGFLSAILYIWAPFHFLSIFVSSAMGVAFSFVFIPVLFLGMYLTRQKQTTNSGIIFISLGLSSIILSHAESLFAIFLPAVAFSFFNLNVGSIKKFFLGLFLGILISSFYLLPAIYYNHFSQSQTGFSTLYQRNFVNFNQLVYSKWGYGPITNNAKDGEISFQIGIAQWLSIIGIIILLILKKRNRKEVGIVFFTILAFILSIFMMLDISLPVWKLITKFIPLDYPTRFMVPATFLASFMAGIFLSGIKNKRLQVISSIILILIALYTNRNHTRVNLYTDIPISLYVASEITTNSYNEYLPINADPKLLNKPHIVVDPPDLLVSEFEQNDKMMSFTLNTSKMMQISIGQFSFPGQTVYLDGRSTKFTKDFQGRISLEIPTGIHKVLVRFEDTLLIKTSKLLSVIGIIILLLLLSKKFTFIKTQFFKAVEKNVKKGF